MRWAADTDRRPRTGPPMPVHHLRRGPETPPARGGVSSSFPAPSETRLVPSSPREVVG
nr:MAG TPA: hypothetical protein [Caudoviricetes sp.]